MTFRSGMKVVAIFEALLWNATQGEAVPQKGCVYTIRSVGTDYDGELMFKLVEIVNAPRDYVDAPVPVECEFWSRGFRPVVENKTDISALIALQDPLNHTPLPEDEIERVLLETADEALR